MIHFRTKLSSPRHGPLFGVVLTPADLAMITAGHPLYLNLEDSDLSGAGGIGVYFVRDSKELVRVLAGAGLDEQGIMDAGLTMDGMKFEPPTLVKKPKKEEGYFS